MLLNVLFVFIALLSGNKSDSPFVFQNTAYHFVTTAIVSSSAASPSLVQQAGLKMFAKLSFSYWFFVLIFIALIKKQQQLITSGKLR